MTITWRGGVRGETDARTALERVAPILRLKPNGRPGEIELGPPGLFDAALTIITGAAQFPKGIPEPRRRRIARTALIGGARSGDLSFERVVETLAEFARSYLSRPVRPLVMLTSWSVKFQVGLERIRTRSARLQFSARIPRRFERRSEDRPEPRHRGAPPNNYAFLRVHVEARCEYDAYEKAADESDLLRAIWNLQLNWRRWTPGQETGRSLNQIVAGPLHTIHTDDGALYGESYWWDPTYLEPHSVKHFGGSLRKIRKFDTDVRKRLRHHTLRRRVEGFLLRYVRALDEPSGRSAFLQLWSLLEQVTGTADGERHDVTVKRAVALVPGAPFERALLHDLRLWRNRMVHEGTEGDDHLAMVQLLKRHIEWILFFLLNEPRAFITMDEWVQFLELPRTPTELRRRAILIRSALRYRRPAVLPPTQPGVH